MTNLQRSGGSQEVETNPDVPAESATSRTSGRYQLSILPTVSICSALIGLVFTIALYCTRYYPVRRLPVLGMMSATWLIDSTCVRDSCGRPPLLLTIHITRTGISTQLRARWVAWPDQLHAKLKSKLKPKPKLKPNTNDKLAEMFPDLLQEHELSTSAPSQDDPRFQSVLLETIRERDPPPIIVVQVDDGVSLERVITTLDLVISVTKEGLPTIWAPEFPERSSPLCGGGCCG